MTLSPSSTRLPRRLVRLAFLLLLPLALLLAVTTFLEKEHGTAWVHGHIYGTTWFTIAWALPGTAALAGLLLQRRRLSAPVQLLHAALLLILAGALVTRFTGVQGAVHLRQGVETTEYYVKPDAHIARLPFSLRLERFRIQYYPGSDRASDYLSEICVTHPDGSRSRHTISMNRIGRLPGGWRLYQSSFDDDGRGSLLSLNCDPWGTGLTYAGYALLLLGFVAVLFHRKGLFRTSLRRLARLTAVWLAVAAASWPGEVRAGTDNGVIPPAQAELFARVQLLNEGRIQPFGTFALHFTRKVTGQHRYRGFTNEQIALGWIFFPEVWQYEPMIEVKSRALRQRLGLKKRAALRDFFTAEGAYRLNDLLDGGDPDLQQAARETQEKIELILMLQQGLLLNLFPVKGADHTVWYAPTDSLPSHVGDGPRALIRHALPLLRAELLQGQTDSVRLFVDKLKAYQQQQGAGTALSARRVETELTYNRLQLTRWISRAALLLGVAGLLALLLPGRRTEPSAPALPTTVGRRSHILRAALRLTPAVLLPALLVELGLRIAVCGRLPLGNGYETLLTLAALLLLLATVLGRRIALAAPFGTLLAGFCLLVSTFGRMDPQILPLAPVLNSPLLGIHVSTIMAAYALLSLLFINSLAALLVPRWRRTPVPTLFAQVLLTPALALLAVGIFLGAVWANVSWGNYWSWDPKETWALITLLAYAVPVHRRTFGFLQRPLVLHSYLCAAFLILLMTYLGVNYLLGGMHSYA